jgi:hypothetical protein
MYRDGETWIWWNSLQIGPDTIASASLPSPVTVNSPYFPLNPQVSVGKVAFRLFPGALVRQVQISDQLESFNEYSKSGIQLIN